MSEPKQQHYAEMTKEQFKEKYPNLLDADINFYLPEKKLLDFSLDYISLRTYDGLIEKQRQYNDYNVKNPNEKPKKLTDIEIGKIKLFETTKQENKIKGFENELVYWDKIYSNPEPSKFKEGLLPDKKTIYKNFLIAYKSLNGIDFIINEQSIKNIEPIIKYFSFDKTYFDSDNVVKKVGNKELQPSFDKGLLIVGNVGNGKTSVMKAMEFMIKYYADLSIKEMWDTSGDWNRLKFRFRTTESLVSEYEYLDTQELKDIFFKTYTGGSLFLDDLKREDKAKNYGITDVVGRLFEQRYNAFKNYTGESKRKFRTFGSMNYHEKYPNDVNFAIEGLGEKYGSHVYDRIFEMFNVIEFKGKSFRK